MKDEKKHVHFLHKELLTPVHPVKLILIGAGATGSAVLTALAKMNHSMIALGHAGLQVTLWDDDTITEANLGRQQFAESETGLHKAVALINRNNRFFGTNWKAVNKKFQKSMFGALPYDCQAGIYITCVDNVSSRFEVAEILNELKYSSSERDKPKYWMDFGNSRDSGQVMLSTVGAVQQPRSELYHTVENLPFVTEEFADLLRQSEETDDTPSCSLAEALEKQDLFINSSLADLGCSLLWKMFRNGMIENRGLFLNLNTSKSTPVPVG